MPETLEQVRKSRKREILTDELADRLHAVAAHLSGDTKLIDLVNSYSGLEFDINSEALSTWGQTASSLDLEIKRQLSLAIGSLSRSGLLTVDDFRGKSNEDLIQERGIGTLRLTFLRSVFDRT